MTPNPTGADIGGVIAELRRLLEQATPGPWIISRPEQKGEDWPHGTIVAATARGMGIYASGDTGTFPSTDRKLIAAARNALPSLLSHIAEMEEREGKLREAAKQALSALDEILGDSDLPNDDRPGVKAMQALSAALAALSHEQTRIEE